MYHLSPKKEKDLILNIYVYTICPGSSDPFYIVPYYIKWVTTSWTHSMHHFSPKKEKDLILKINVYTICPGSSDPFYIVPTFLYKMGSLLPGHTVFMILKQM